MLAPLDYDRYRILDEVVRLPELRILWAEVDGRRVQLVAAPPVPQTGRLTVLRRLAEREALGIDGVCGYLASGVDEQRTWVSFAAPDTPTFHDLADAIRTTPELGDPLCAARVVADAAGLLREVVKHAPSLPAGGLHDVRIAADGRVTLGFLGEILLAPRLEEAAMVTELGRWLERLCGRGATREATGVVAGIASGSIRRLASLADDLEQVIDEAGGVPRSAVVDWIRRHGAATPSIAPPALIDDPLDPDPGWVLRGATPRTPVSRRSASADADADAPTELPTHSPSVGSTIGGYRLIQRVANGMMGRVYEAVRLSDDKRVALKLILPPDDDDPDQLAEVRARFRREVEALARLSHPNIVKILEYGYDAEGWLSMEYVEGSTLAKILRSEGPLQVDDAVTVARQLCSALGHAHSNGVIHRDLKPANVILEADDPARVRLVDFGLAKDWDGDGDLTNDGTLLGTPHYMSPEQCRGEPARVESDLYALGMLLYRLLTGRMPFDDKRGAAVFIAHLREPVPMFASLGLSEERLAELPPALEAVVRKCLEKRPENRYRSALALDFALRTCLDPAAALAPPPRAPTAPESPLKQLLALQQEGMDHLIQLARRAGPKGLVAALLIAAMVGMMVVGGATSATVAYFVTRGGGRSADGIGAQTSPGPRVSLTAVEVPPILAEDHPPAIDPKDFDAEPGPRQRRKEVGSGDGPSDGSDGADDGNDGVAADRSVNDDAAEPAPAPVQTADPQPSPRPRSDDASSPAPAPAPAPAPVPAPAPEPIAAPAPAPAPAPVPTPGRDPDDLKDPFGGG